jgi:hypothetical protein
VAEDKKPLEKKLEEKSVVVGVPGTPMTPQEAQENVKQVDEEQKKLTEVPEDQRDVPPDAEINKPPQPSDPETVKSARMREKESGESKAKRVDTADVSPEGEKAPAGWGKKPTVYVMTNVDGEKLNVTVKQWAKYGQKLRSKGWTTPEFAQGDQGGSEEIPQDIEWGKDKAE